MRGHGEPQQVLFSFRSMDERIPATHPLRAMRAMVDPILVRLGPHLDALYADPGRASMPGR